ncbi:type II secretion system protein [Motilimonas pumila]|uniref:Type II secretion system protein n=2 Tax=Motilimonas pumila TaxID=2303987 RepID=A0A418YE27_9GAMM|nr:type II secretion system protein [Motilimonas pumila]
MIELLVVLALIGLIAGIALPRLWGQVTKAQQRQAVENIWSLTFSNIRAELRSGRAVALDADFVRQATAKREQLEQWQVEVPVAIVYRPHKVTTGGDIYLSDQEGASWLINISRLDGHVEIRQR